LYLFFNIEQQISLEKLGAVRLAPGDRPLDIGGGICDSLGQTEKGKMGSQ
jgi:hypothetical protein